jgi:hypothetical protein
MSVGPSVRNAVAFAEPDPAVGSMLGGKMVVGAGPNGSAAQQASTQKVRNTRPALRRPFGSSGASPSTGPCPELPLVLSRNRD